jgi:hypothetical protein
LEFGRIAILMNVESAAEKARSVCCLLFLVGEPLIHVSFSQALHEAVSGALEIYGENSLEHCLALAGNGWIGERSFHFLVI